MNDSTTSKQSWQGIRRCYETKGDVDPNAATNGYFYFETKGP